MNLTVKSRHVEMTSAMEGYVREKAAKVLSHFDQVVSAAFKLEKSAAGMTAKAHVRLKGKELHVEETDADMYAAIDKMAPALHEALSRRLGKDLRG